MVMISGSRGAWASAARMSWIAGLGAVGVDRELGAQLQRRHMRRVGREHGGDERRALARPAPVVGEHLGQA